ncbi:Poly(ADP-ribose) glycohydrolase [Phytophthora cactorum]|nr:Poly(ADP-ribose) glycohydrolase [Phytophthora cactorum]
MKCVALPTLGTKSFRWAAPPSPSTAYRRRRHELTALLQSNNGALYDVADTVNPDFVYVITATGRIVSLLPRSPTCHSSRDTFLATGDTAARRWLRPDSHPFFEPPARPSDMWLQYPAQYQDAADQDELTPTERHHAGPQSFRIDRTQDATALLAQLPLSGEVPLWPYITAMLAQPIRDTHDLSSRLQLYGSRDGYLSDPRRRFNCLEYAVNELLKHEEQTKFFRDVLPEMARLVLNMPQLFATPPPLLTPLEADEHAESNSVSSSGATQAGESSDSSNKARVATQTHRFTKLEVLTLVCGCFFGIFPEQDIVKCVQPDDSPQNKKAGRRSSNDDDVIEFPYFTAVRMFSAPGNMGRLVVLKAQKIRCLLQYSCVWFHAHSPTQTPQELLKMLEPGESNTDAVPHPQLCGARCVSDTLIEDLDKHLQIDFANKFAGGGVLNSGCVQEEIRFLLSPELLVSCLVFAKLEPHEAFVIHGTERYSAYQGYGGSFVYSGNFEDTTSFETSPDGCLRRQCVIVGIDATDYGSARVERQYTRGHVWRDLVKAFAGFAYPDAHDGKLWWPVATGNWGCGVFQGDRELKFLIQWLAASIRQRELVYVLFERDLDLQTKVDPLLTLATCAKAREWDRQSGGVMQWLTEFLFNELSAALASLQLPPKNQQQDTESELKQLPQDSPVSLGSKQEPSATPRREEPSDEEEAQDDAPNAMQDFFSTK